MNEESDSHEKTHSNSKKREDKNDVDNNNNNNNRGLKRKGSDNDEREIKKRKIDSNLNNYISLFLGNHQSKHDSTKSFMTIVSNFTKTEIQNAYSVGEKKLNFQFQKLKNKTLTKEQSSHLTKSGINLDDIEGEGVLVKRGDEYGLTPESFAYIWLKVAKLGNTNFKYATADFEQLPIGGASFIKNSSQ